MPNADPSVKRARPRKKPKGRFHHGDLREAAIEEATRMVDEGGASSVSLRKIAKKLGVTDPALYRHFNDREEVFAEVGLRGYLTAMERMAAAVEGAADLRSALVGVGRAYVYHCVENVGWFRLTHSRDYQDQYGDLDGAPELGALAMRLEQATKRRMAEVMPADDIDDQYRAVWALAIGLSTLVAERAFRRVETDAERLAVADRVIELQVDTLLIRYGHGAGVSR